MRKRLLIIAAAVIVFGLFLGFYLRGKMGGTPRLLITYVGFTNSTGLGPGPTAYCAAFNVTNADSRRVGFEFDAVEWETAQGLESFDFHTNGWVTSARRWNPNHANVMHIFLPPGLATNGIPWRAHVTSWYEQGAVDWLNGVAYRFLKREIVYRNVYPSYSIVLSNLPPFKPY